ncbi:alpha/beta hydrolase [Rhodopirellula bahusiensis]|uniref:alpha/beta hydrolase n=1 Tax=Rhodopirellula bahusiensis TaxID=2014065 RepID=UPI003263B669
MIVATNRLYKPSVFLNDWRDVPDPSGEIHWLNVESSKGYHVPDSEIPISIRELLLRQLDCADKREVLVFVTGGRKFDCEDFTDFERKISQSGFDGIVVGFSPPFSSGLKAYKNPADQFHKSHASCGSFATFVQSLLKLPNTGISLMAQSAGNDFCARALGKFDILPKINRIVAAASLNASESYSPNAVGKPIEEDYRPVTNATAMIDSCEHFTCYYRADDAVLKNLKAPPPPLFGVEPRSVYGHPDKVSLVDCTNVPREGEFKHVCYEKLPTVLEDIVKVLKGRVGDQKL